MSLQTATASTGRSNRPIAIEFALVVAVLLGSFVWQRVIVTALVESLDAQPWFSNLPASILLSAGLFVAGYAILVGGYVTVRNIEIGSVIPSSDDYALVGLAAVVPAALVGLTKLWGVLTGVQFNSLTKTWYGEASVTQFLFIGGIGTVVLVSVLLLACQVLIQGSFRKVVDDDLAIVATTLLAGFMFLSGTGGFATVPDRGKLIGGGLFVLALGLALYATERVDRDELRYLAYVPFLAFLALTILSGIAEIGSVAQGLFVFTHIAVLAIAAYSYDRTDSLLVPAIAYLSLLLTSDIVVFFLDTGMGNW